MTRSLFGCLRPFRLKNIDDIEQSSYGVYGFWYKRRCIYIGKAGRQPISNRLRQHWSETHNPLLKDWLEAKGKEITFAYQVIPNRDQIDAYERFYIRQFQPVTNKIRFKNI